MDEFNRGYKSYANALENQLAVIAREEPGHYEFIKDLQNPDDFRFPKTVPMTKVYFHLRPIMDYFYPVCKYREEKALLLALSLNLQREQCKKG